MKREEAKQLAETALKDLQQALQSGQSDSLRKVLDVMSRFHQYSWNNCLLIAFQRPEATYVAGFRKWLELRRHVRKGEKGIGILAPLAYRRQADSDDGEDGTTRGIRGFKVVHVFDVSQTVGEDLPELARITGDPGEMLERMENVIRTGGIVLKYEPLPLGTKGVSRKGEIAIAEGLDEAERFAVLVHELAHERLHDDERRKETTKTVRETEAEAVAYVVCRTFGLDCSTRSSDYIQLYRGTAETLTDSLQVIQSTASRMIEELSQSAVADLVA
jgi:antirestriction protein ArdC